MKTNEYKCAHCQKIHTKGWTDEEAEKEFNEFEYTKKELKDGMTVVCDDCYSEYLKWLETNRTN